MRKNQKVRALLFTLILAFFAVGTIAIAKEVMKNVNMEPIEVVKTTATSPQWVTVELINPSAGQNPANLRITGLASAPPQSSSSECALDNTSEICMARLDLANFSGNATDLIDETVQYAINNNAPVFADTEDDGYARHPEKN